MVFKLPGQFFPAFYFKIVIIVYMGGKVKNVIPRVDGGRAIHLLNK